MIRDKGIRERTYTVRDTILDIDLKKLDSRKLINSLMNFKSRMIPENVKTVKTFISLTNHFIYSFNEF